MPTKLMCNRMHERYKYIIITVKPGQAYPPRTHYSKVESVASCRFQIDLCILVCVMSREFTRGSYEISTSSIFLKLM